MADASAAPAAATWFPVLTLLLGFGASSLNDWLKDRRAARREDVRRQAEREEQQAMRRAEFQRTTLLDLQEVCADLARASGKAHMHDLRVFRETDVWGRSLMSDGDAEHFRVCQVRSSLLGARVNDSYIRDLTARLKAAAVDGSTARSEQAAELAQFQMSNAFDELNSAIGKALRQLDGGP